MKEKKRKKKLSNKPQYAPLLPSSCPKFLFPQICDGEPKYLPIRIKGEKKEQKKPPLNRTHSNHFFASKTYFSLSLPPFNLQLPINTSPQQKSPRWSARCDQRAIRTHIDRYLSVQRCTSNLLWSHHRRSQRSHQKRGRWCCKGAQSCTLYRTQPWWSRQRQRPESGARCWWLRRHHRSSRMLFSRFKSG